MAKMRSLNFLFQVRSHTTRICCYCYSSRFIQISNKPLKNWIPNKFRSSNHWQKFVCIHSNKKNWNSQKCQNHWTWLFLNLIRSQRSHFFRWRIIVNVWKIFIWIKFIDRDHDSIWFNEDKRSSFQYKFI